MTDRQKCHVMLRCSLDERLQWRQWVLNNNNRGPEHFHAIIFLAAKLDFQFAFRKNDCSKETKKTGCARENVTLENLCKNFLASTTSTDFRLIVQTRFCKTTLKRGGFAELHLVQNFKKAHFKSMVLSHEEFIDLL